MATTATTTSMGRSSFLNLWSNSVEPRVRPTVSHGSGSSCGKVFDGGSVAMWLVNGVAAAFFASLERCSCIYIATKEDDGDVDGNDDVPLIPKDESSRRERGIVGNRRKNGRSGKKKGGYFVDEDFIDEK